MTRLYWNSLNVFCCRMQGLTVLSPYQRFSNSDNSAGIKRGNLRDDKASKKTAHGDKH